MGPLLFLIYFYDLPLVIKFATVMIFADDLKIYIALLHTDPTYPLQNDISSLALWTEEAQLGIAFEKCFIWDLVILKLVTFLGTLRFSQ